MVEHAAPPGPGSELLVPGSNFLPVVLAETSVQINLVKLEPAGVLPEVATNPEEKDDGNGKHGLEEVLSSTGTALPGRSDGSEGLGSENDEAEEETHPRAPNSTGSLEGNVVQGATLKLPGGSEANVGLKCVRERKRQRRRLEHTKQMEPQVKRAARPERARSQSKTTPPEEARTM